MLLASRQDHVDQTVGFCLLLFPFHLFCCLKTHGREGECRPAIIGFLMVEYNRCHNFVTVALWCSSYLAGKAMSFGYNVVKNLMI